MSETIDEQLFFDVEQKTDKQHILDNPDTYIGSVELIENVDMWVMNETDDKIQQEKMNYIPGLFKLFDEGIVNCRDHYVRMQSKIAANVENSLPVTYIDISIQEDGTIVMTNDGNGIDVVKHPTYQIWVPELIFGHLRTSTNYNKEEKKIVGGKNGFGFKLVLIWSTFGSIETVDHIRGLKYTQEFSNNLDIIHPPTVVRSKCKPYTKITFKPDYARLGISGLDQMTIALLKKRVYDIAAVTDKCVRVKYNSVPIPVKTFEQYVNMYIGAKSITERVYEQPDPRWEYAVSVSSHGFRQVSFVNGIYTPKGGRHVEYILNQITQKLIKLIEKKKKVSVTASAIREQLFLFLRCDIENPAFDSQTKDYMNTPFSKFGSRCEVSDKFIEKAAKMGIMETACAIHEIKDGKLAKKTDGSKTRSVKGITKLDDANWAGTNNSKLCTLILCEGDSAKTAVMSGLTASDRDTIGVFPLKGKLMNVRGENVRKVSENIEIANIKKSLGLETGKEYESMEEVYNSLRYGRIALLTDQDYDGSHIKGLCVNLFHNVWQSLTELEGFICFMNTPILKAKRGNQELKFYNEGEYEVWKNEFREEISKWTIKYYKGLGTSTKNEFKEYFKEKKFVNFKHTGEESDRAIDIAFNKSRAEDRKLWLENVYDKNSFVDTSQQIITYEDFVNKELIHFSKYDCDRSIPNLVDGLKISLRKILYGAFKRKLVNEIKVAQFSAYVSEHSSYHHGEQSLNMAIVGLAQNFVGSNNINLLVPSGQFGSRIQGGKDSASPRYIFTKLESITRCIFPEQDDRVLKYLDDDGTQVEPQYYIPIIPMILVNGTSGIGTGFSSDIMCYNPKDIIAYLRNKLRDLENTIEFTPYYEGFNGDVIKVSDTKFMFKGKYQRIGEDTIKVTELPVGFWTEDFKELIETLKNDKDKEGKRIVPIIKDSRENNTDTTIDTEIVFSKGKLQEYESIVLEKEYGINGVEKLLKLTKTNTTTNMHLFDWSDKLTKYDSVSEIIDDYYHVRLDCYEDRKDYMIENLEKEIILLSNKVKYIHEVLEGTIDLRKMKKQEITNMFIEKNYAMIDNDEDFKYLVRMPMDSVSEENVQRLLKQHQEKEAELEIVRNTTIQDMWLSELDKLEQEYNAYVVERNLRQNGINEEARSSEEQETIKKKIVKKVGVKKIAKKVN
jgi:DNA topoisomerase-2